MRRLARGGTTHPALVRPGMGYGRPLRPQPGLAATGTNLLDDVQAFLRGEAIVARSDEGFSVTSLESAAVIDLR